MALDLTIAILDVFLSITFIIIGWIFLPKLPRYFGFKVTFFKMEKVTQKERLRELKEKKERLIVTEKALQKGVD